MTNNKKITTAVFGDLTALYAMRTYFRRPINYSVLDKGIKRALGVDTIDSNQWFTLCSDRNDDQIKFINGLKDLGWNIEMLNQRDIQRGTRSTDYRFNAQIGYHLGACAEDKILVVSDSYDLAYSINDLHKLDQAPEIHLACMTEAIAPQYLKGKLLKNNGGFIHFHDLDELLIEDKVEV